MEELQKENLMMKEQLKKLEKVVDKQKQKNNVSVFGRTNCFCSK